MTGHPEQSSTGLQPRVAATLAYLAGPFSGVLLLVAESASSYVRFHAWQSVIGLGALGVLVGMLLALAFASLIVSARVFYGLYLLTGILWLVWIGCWVACLVQAFQGRRWKLPIAGTYAERFSRDRSA
jgi:uncharacterized membrane protein